MDLFTRPKLLKQYCHILLTNITNIKRKKYLSVCENKKDENMFINIVFV